MGSTKTTGLTLAIVGCGIMCSSILEGVLAKTIEVEKTGKEPLISNFIGTVQSDASVERLKKRFPERLRIVQGDNLEAMQEADIVMLGCKPYMAEKVLGAQGVAKALKGKLLISVLVGTTPDKLDHCMYRTYLTPANENSRYRPEPKPFTYIRRAIPNLAAEYGESATVVQTTGSVAETSHPSHAPLPEHYQEAFDFIFTSIGKVHPVAPDLFDIAGILSGPGAVYMTVALDGMLDGGVQQGLKRNDGKKILAQALKGLAAILEGGMHPAVLRESASSPRGVTIEGLLTLEEERVRHAYSKATIRANQKSLNM